MPAAFHLLVCKRTTHSLVKILRASHVDQFQTKFFLITLELRSWIYIHQLLFYCIIASYIANLKEKEASTENQADLLSKEVEQLKEDLEVSFSPRISVLGADYMASFSPG